MLDIQSYINVCVDGTIVSEKIIKKFDASFYEFDVANNFFDAAYFSAQANKYN